MTDFMDEDSRVVAAEVVEVGERPTDVQTHASTCELRCKVSASPFHAARQLCSSIGTPKQYGVV